MLHPTLIAELIVTAEAAQRPDHVAPWKQLAPCKHVAQDVERATAALKLRLPTQDRPLRSVVERTP